MADIEIHMDGSLARAARHLIQVSARTIARYSGIDTETLRRYEKGGDALTVAEIERVTEALVHYGARFVPEDETGGCGVRRKFSRTTVARIENWESEGGPVADDDV
ncbi:helix-turn-helix domain-containing protein [Gordonia shandongensis]|uniref:helix-turn-helix domain-containing protein n=1 Tax=Gordonia shandongensis TaxID=376351 RepID=UPI000402EA8E|nr:helix-turn-helix transcriptional regulator [Gordonia shandongensis]